MRVCDHRFAEVIQQDVDYFICLKCNLEVSPSEMAEAVNAAYLVEEKRLGESR